MVLTDSGQEQFDFDDGEKSVESKSNKRKILIGLGSFVGIFQNNRTSNIIKGNTVLRVLATLREYDILRK